MEHFTQSRETPLRGRRAVERRARRPALHDRRPVPRLERELHEGEEQPHVDVLVSVVPGAGLPDVEAEERERREDVLVKRVVVAVDVVGDLFFVFVFFRIFLILKYFLIFLFLYLFLRFVFFVFFYSSKIKKEKIEICVYMRVEQGRRRNRKRKKETKKEKREERRAQKSEIKF